METQRMSRPLANHDCNAALAVELLGANLFGPQSQWSSLLGQRERLLHELKRGRRYLEHLRKDLAECSALFQSGAAEGEGIGSRWVLSVAQQVSGNDAMEQFLLQWLERVEERLGDVNERIEAVETPDGEEPLDPEESMFDLLRAAG